MVNAPNVYDISIKGSIVTIEGYKLFEQHVQVCDSEDDAKFFASNIARQKQLEGYKQFTGMNSVRQDSNTLNHYDKIDKKLDDSFHGRKLDDSPINYHNTDYKELKESETKKTKKKTRVKKIKKQTRVKKIKKKTEKKFFDLVKEKIMPKPKEKKREKVKGNDSLIEKRSSKESELFQ